MDLIHYGSQGTAECGADVPNMGLTMIAANVTCPTCRGWLPIVAPELQRVAKCDKCDEMSATFEVLYGTLVDFNERKQEFFCKVCRYRDPLGPDGNKLHDDNCPLLEMAKAVEGKRDGPALRALKEFGRPVCAKHKTPKRAHYFCLECREAGESPVYPTAIHSEGK